MWHEEEPSLEQVKETFFGFLVEFNAKKEKQVDTYSTVFEASKTLLTLSTKLRDSKEISAFFEDFHKHPGSDTFLKAILLNNEAAEYFNYSLRTENTGFAQYLLSLPYARDIINSPKEANPRSIGETLYTIIDTGYEDIFYKYMELVKDPDRLMVGIYTSTPLLFYLLQNNKAPWLFTILEKYSKELGTVLFDVDKHKRNLLHHAVIQKNIKMVEHLIKKGLPIHQKDLFGFTPLDLALFDGELEIAMLLSGLPKDQLEKDPRYKNHPPHFVHRDLTSKALRFIEKTYDQQITRERGVPTERKVKVELELPSARGVCNGWSFMAALAASGPFSVNDPSSLSSPASLVSLSADSDKEIYLHYRMSEQLSNWNERQEELDKPIPELQDFKSKREFFEYFTRTLFALQAQYSAPVFLSQHERVKQLNAVSSKRHIAALADFGLPDLTNEEYAFVLNAYQPIANNCIIDAGSGGSYLPGHDVTFYQLKENKIFYFDSNIPYLLPTYSAYQELLKDVLPSMEGQPSTLAIFHNQPNKLDPALQAKADAITDELIEKLIVSKKARFEKLDEILVLAVHKTPLFLKRLLNHPKIRNQISSKKLGELAAMAVRDERSINFEVMRIIYHQAKSIQQDLSQEPVTVLIVFFKTAILYDDEIMYNEIRDILQKKIAQEPLGEARGQEFKQEFERYLLFTNSLKTLKPHAQDKKQQEPKPKPPEAPKGST